MTLYYFDLIVGDDFSIDEEGVECVDGEAMQREAAIALADMARDAVHFTLPSTHLMAIQVRDADGPVLRVSFRFEINRND